MREMIFTDENGVSYKRVCKQTAKKLYKNNEEIILCAVNLNPFSMYHPSCAISNKKSDVSWEFENFYDEYEETSFDKYVNSFEYYNCICAETGYYASFYVRV